MVKKIFFNNNVLFKSGAQRARFVPKSTTAT